MPAATSHHKEIEEAISIAEETITSLDRRTGETERCEARWLERMVQALRLALIADVEVTVLTRLHLRLETAIRRASMLLAEHPDGESTIDDMPASQRPTFRPPSAEKAVVAEEDPDRGPPSQRPTIPPRPASGFVKKVGSSKRRIA